MFREDVEHLSVKLPIDTYRQIAIEIDYKWYHRDRFNNLIYMPSMSTQWLQRCIDFGKKNKWNLYPYYLELENRTI